MGSLQLFKLLFFVLLWVHFKQQVDSEVLDAFLKFPSVHFSFFYTEWSATKQAQVLNNFGAKDQESSDWNYLLYIMFLMLSVVIANCIQEIMDQRMYSCRSIFFFIRLIAIHTVNIIYWHIFFYEKCLYNNHHYLYGNILLLYSLDSLLPDSSVKEVFLWKALQIQIAIVYCYAGWAKLLSVDWIMNAQPLFLWFFEGNFSWKAYMWDILSAHSFKNVVLVGKSTFSTNGFFNDVSLMLSFVMSYYSLFVDLFGGLVLFFGISNRLVKIFLCLLGGFHVFNCIFFDIGTFPGVMLSTTFLWWVPGCRTTLITFSDWINCIRYSRNWEFFVYMLVFLFIILQIVIPLRFVWTSDDINWTKDGHYFSWRMMINQEDTLTQFVAMDRSRPNPSEYWINSFPHDMNLLQIIPHQRKVLGYDPPLMQQFAREYVYPLIVQKHGTSRNHTSVYVNSWRSLNNRPFQRWVKPDLDLVTSQMKSCWAWNLFCSHSDWILPRSRELETLSARNTWEKVRHLWHELYYECVLFAGLRSDSFVGSFQKFSYDLRLFVVSGEIEYYNYTADKTEFLSESTVITFPFESTFEILTLSESSLFGFAIKDAFLSFPEALAMN